MAKKSTKKRSGGSKKSTRTRSPRTVDADGKHLVIVESPTKAKTINKYLGSDYLVMASVGHVRDLPSRNPKGVKDPVPGVDLDKDFEPTYEILPKSKKTVTDLKRAAKKAADVWFATDLDREGEAIAWHLAQALNLPVDEAKRVVFNAITKAEIEHAFAAPRSIDQKRVDAQQARRILDRIVGYQVSPLLWKKVAGGLSAGRVQSVAVRLVVEREREIDAFVPQEYWKITGLFATDVAQAGALADAWQQWLKAEENGRTVKAQNAWLSEHRCVKAELTEVDGKPFKPDDRKLALDVAQRLGFVLDQADEREDEKAKGPARSPCTYHGHVGDAAPAFRISSIETKRTRSRPSAPFITSSMQQTAANRIGFQLQRTMRVAQQLYEGVDLHGVQGQTGLITYMRTDSTHLTGEAIEMARTYIDSSFGKDYLPQNPNVYKSSNKSAQEAHEAIRPTDVSLTPDSIKSELTEDQFKLYRLIWQRFVACQMTPAQWDATTILIQSDPHAATFKASGRTLVFDGHLRVAGVPNGDDVILPPLEQEQPLGPMRIEPTQHFTPPPPRYTEASLQKKLEEEGIGRPSTYAPIIQTIQDRKYVETVAPRDRRLRATDLGTVVTNMLSEAFPRIMDIPYTREMEAELDKIEDEDHDWRQMLRTFYGPFKEKLEKAHETIEHAKAATEDAPYECPDCGAKTVYRFGRNGRFLSCSAYPDCKYAAPIDREGKPMQPQETDIICPIDGRPLIKRTGRFGPFLASQGYPDVKFILKLDPKKQTVVLPKVPPLLTDQPCPKCESPLYLRDSKRGFWLSCSTFPKCRGRGRWADLEEEKQKQLEAAWVEHCKANPLPVIETTDGKTVEEGYHPQIAGDDESSPDNLSLDAPSSDAA